MRKRNREMAVFSLSAIDLFASAMGAFAIITFVLMPSYQMNARKDEVVPVEDTPPDPKAMQGLIAAEFGVVIQWESPGVDIDLHVIHASEMVWWKNKETLWMILFEDEQRPENEISEVAAQTKLKPFVNEGEYEVRVCYYDSSSPLRGPVDINGLILLKPQGQEATSKTFEVKVNAQDSFERNKGVLAATFRIKRVGNTFGIEFSQ